MSQTISVFYWLIPLFIPPVAYVSHRWLPHKKVRMALYSVVIVAAFVFDLLFISFRNQTLDTIFYLTLTLVFVEIYWSLVGLGGKKFFLISFVPAVMLYVFVNLSWFASGPVPQDRRHFSCMDSFSRKDTTYTLKRRISRDIRVPSYEYTLNKSIPNTPFEKRLDSYVTPEGYFNAEYSYIWKVGGGTVSLNLIADEDTLWLLGTRR